MRTAALAILVLAGCAGAPEPEPSSVWIVSWRVHYQNSIPCDPVIDPWTGEPATAQPAMSCFEDVEKWMNKEFATQAEANAFVDNAPDETFGGRQVENLTVREVKGGPY